MRSLILRRPEVRFSTSSAGGGGTSLESLEGINADGTLGTGGAFFGLAERLGVAGREPPLVFRTLAADGGRVLLDGVPTSAVVGISATDAAVALFRRLASSDGDGSCDASGKSFPSIVVRRLLRMACWRGVAGLGE